MKKKNAKTETNVNDQSAALVRGAKATTRSLRIRSRLRAGCDCPDDSDLGNVAYDLD